MERTIIGKAMDYVEDGSRFRVDLEKRSLYIDRKCLIKDGVYEGKLTDTEFFSIAVLESLYYRYKHSRPSERSDSKQKRYFRALKLNELSDDDMLYGDDREIAQLRLETYLLSWILSGLFVWDEESMGKWFWQSQNDKDLVILRSWVEGTK